MLLAALTACWLTPARAEDQTLSAPRRPAPAIPGRGGIGTLPDELPPRAALVAHPSRGPAPAAITLDASASTDPERAIVSYAFDFGDGAGTGPQATPVTSHVFAAGQWTVTVLVTDASHQTSSATLTVVSSRPPTAALALAASSGVAPFAATLDASASRDPDGDALTYRFDFGDGTTAGPQASPVATHVYGGGIWFPAVEVADPDGARANAGEMVAVNSLPVPVLDVEPAAGTAPLQIVADGSRSFDPDGEALVYWVDFGDGTTVGPLFDPVTLHDYGPGHWTLTLTVADEWGARATTTRVVTVDRPPNVPPIASLIATPGAGTAPLEVELDAGASLDLDGRLVSYRFEFGDGATAGPQLAPLALHTYAPGRWTARVTVTDDSGAVATTVAAIGANGPPAAALVAQPNAGDAPLTVALDAAGSSDPEGGRLQYRFDFGDGASLGPQGAARVTHLYGAGVWNATVTVFDSAGAAAATGAAVRVNARPIVHLTASPLAGNAPLAVALDGAASRDPEGGRLQYRFDFGDGAAAGPQPGATAAHAYAAGHWTARLTVTDSTGAAAIDSAGIAVNAIPIAVLHAAPDSGNAPLAVTLDATGSADPDLGTLSYRFLFGDGAAVGPQSQRTATHTYAVGDWSALVIVTDPSGAGDTAFATIRARVPPNVPPVAVLAAGPGSGNAPLAVTLDASGSHDADGAIASYRFVFGDGGALPPQASAIASHTYAAGTWTARVTVTDARGDTAAATATVEVNAPPTAALVLSPPSGVEPLTLVANASGSSDPEGRPLSFRFDFGDATGAGPQAAASASHTYVEGNFTVRVTVTDAFGASAVASVPLTVTPPPNRAPVPALAVRLGALPPDSGFVPLLTDPAAVRAVPAVPRPAYLERTTDPTFHTRVARVTELGGIPFTTASGAGTWGADARHHYSKDQPWNSDGTLLAVQNSGSPRQVLLDGTSYAPTFGECTQYPRGDDRWHPSPQYPHVRINAKGDELMWYDVVSCTMLRHWTLPFPVLGIGDGEGNPSRDGRYLALCDSSRFFVVDMDPQPPYAPYPNVRIGPVQDFVAGCGLSECRLGWVAVSPSGKYLVCKYGDDHPRVYDLDPATLVATPRPMPAGSPRCAGTAAAGYVYDVGHCDLTQNPFDANEDVLIGQEHCGWRGTTVGGQSIGGVVLVRLRDGRITPLTEPTNEAYPHHVSAQALDRPGWIYVGYYPEPGKRFSDEIVALKIDGSGAVQRLAHKHSLTPDCYRCEAHAVPSRDGRRVMWASNWASGCSVCGSPAEIKGYVVDLRADTVSRAPWSAPATVTADASASSDPDGSIVSYTFDFGDGASAGPQTSATATHTYAQGQWTLALTVRDNGGVTRSTSTSITVTGPPPDRAPVVTAPSVASARPGDTLRVVAWVADPDGDAIQSFTADLSALPAGASFAAKPGNGSGTLTWIPSAVGGPYRARFVAANALTGADTTWITISTSNHPPVAALAASPALGAAPMTTTLDASGSTDPDGGSRTYVFDFGDGVVVGPQSSALAAHTYASGDWTATVTAIDPLGAQDQATVLVRALPNLVGNPSFEISTSGWNANGGSTIARVAGGRDGSYCLEAQGPDSIGSFGANDSPNWVATVPAAGKRYRFSAWVRAASSKGAAKLRVREYLNGIQQGATLHSASVALGTSWQQVTVDAQAGVAGSTLDFQVLDAPLVIHEVFQIDQVAIVALPDGVAFTTGETRAAPDPAPAPRAPESAPIAFGARVRPNPARGAITLEVSLGRPGETRVELFDVGGRLVAARADRLAPGRHALRFEGRRSGGRFGAGVYFYRVRAAEGVHTGRFVVVE